MISINWSTFVIFIPRADMPIIQASPEIRELDIDAFRLDLKAIEAAEEGVPWPDTHRHVAEVTLSGFVYARIVEILDPYTVEFEDGQYSVVAFGANHNVLDVKINNQVSLAVQNSAGLINNPDIQHSSFNGGVTVDLTSSNSGTKYPVGTPRRPVNNFTDALLIAIERGFVKLFLLGTGITLDGGNDFRGFQLEGQSPSATSVTVSPSALVSMTEFRFMTAAGTFDGTTVIENCMVDNVSGIEGEIKASGIRGTITLAAGTSFLLIDCYDAVAGVGIPTINYGGVGMPLIVRNFQGGLKVQNKSGSDEASIDLNPGRLILDSTIIDGAFIVKGIGPPVDNQSTGTTTVDETALVSPESVSDAVWDEDPSDHLASDTFGRAMNLLRYQGAIWINTSSGTPGIVEGKNGTQNLPVDTLADALTLAGLTGLQHLVIITGSLILDAPLNEFFVELRNESELNFGGQSVNGSEFSGGVLKGVMSGRIVVSGTYHTEIEDVTGLRGDISGAGLTGTIILGAGRTSFSGCHSHVPGYGTPIIIFGDPTTEMSMRDYSGGVELQDMDDVGNVSSCEFVAGQIILSSTCLAVATLVLRGIAGPLTNNGTIVPDVEGMVFPADTALARKYQTNKKVWDFTPTPVQLIIYDDDGVTELARLDMETDVGEKATTVEGVATKQTPA